MVRIVLASCGAIAALALFAGSASAVTSGGGGGGGGETLTCSKTGQTWQGGSEIVTPVACYGNEVEFSVLYPGSEPPDFCDLFGYWVTISDAKGNTVFPVNGENNNFCENGVAHYVTISSTDQTLGLTLQIWGASASYYGAILRR